ncbi:MAG: HEPN domain-containing protein [Anaerolineales bacterium]|nr:HEPN domain-containing protein [Anaerolineales bacterium]
MKVNDAKVWLAYAKSDLDAAHILLKQGEFFPRQICFMAQQAGEKALKAVLVFLEINFPKTHDLDRLRELIPQGWQVKEKFPELYELSVWAVESRYPAHAPDVVENEAREALLLAEAVYKSVESELEEKIRKSTK